MAEVRAWTCADCGGLYYARRERANRCCYECSRRHAREAAEQMQKKQGPYYERWREAMEQAMWRLPRGH